MRFPAALRQCDGARFGDSFGQIFVGHVALSAFYAVVRCYAAGRAERLIVIGWHAECGTQLFVELAQIHKLRGLRGVFASIIEEQKFLIAGVPQTGELAVQQDRRQNRHLVAAVGCPPKLRAAAVFFHTHDATCAANHEAYGVQALQNERLRWRSRSGPWPDRAIPDENEGVSAKLLFLSQIRVSSWLNTLPAPPHRMTQGRAAASPPGFV